MKEIWELVKEGRMWHIWRKTIGSKATDNNKDAVITAKMRTAWIIMHIITCFFIIWNALINTYVNFGIIFTLLFILLPIYICIFLFKIIKKYSKDV